MNKQTKQFGFTLIELLVVISIISLLISILLPALGNARKSALSVKCLANQRQLGIGLMSYADSYDSTLMSGMAYNVPSSGSGRWYQILDWYLYSGDKGYNNVEVNAMFRCPLVQDQTGMNHYSVHAALMPITSPGPNDKRRPYSIDEILRPTEIVLLIDGALNSINADVNLKNTSQQYNTYDPSMDNDAVIGQGNNIDGSVGASQIRFRHSADTVANALFPDGHASTIKYGNFLRKNSRTSNPAGHKF